ncbi:hypothetical protein DITRI_Ditri11bG0158600 [Diplodiscus trichospermus]
MALLAESSVKAACSAFTVLLVDVDLISLYIISTMLRMWGYGVMIAKQATDAFRIIRDRRYEIDLVLANSYLPDMGKYELLETMRKMSNLPVIFMFSVSDPIAMRGCLFKGAVSYFLKPITIDNVKNLRKFVVNEERENLLAVEETSGIEEESSPENASGVDVESQPLISEGRQNLKNDEEENDDSKVLGTDGAHPKKILRHMNVPGLNKDVLSHLQKYCLSLKQERDATHQSAYLARDWMAEWVTNNGQFLFHQIGNSEQLLKGGTDLFIVGDSGLESPLYCPMLFDGSLLEKQRALLPEPWQLPLVPQNQDEHDNFGAETGRESDELFTIGKGTSELFYHNDFDSSSSDQSHV